MKIGYISDLHLDHSNLAPITNPGWDVLVVAGDIAEDTGIIKNFFANTIPKDIPVLYVPGNHEFAYQNIQDRHLELESICDEAGVIYLQDYTIIKDTLFVGATLWSDFDLDGQDYRQYNMEWAESNIRDFRVTSYEYEPLTAVIMRKMHSIDRCYLNFILRHVGPEVKNRVVVTHFAPNKKSIHPQYAMNLNAYWVSDMADISARADLWIHGHVHSSFDYEDNGCRFVCNPRGYSSVYDISMENPDFDKYKTVEI